MKRFYIFLINRIPMIIIGIPIVCYLYAVYGNPSERFFEIANTVSLYIVFTPVFLFLLGGLYMTLTDGFEKVGDKCRCCCKCCCCKGEK